MQDLALLVFLPSTGSWSQMPVFFITAAVIAHYNYVIVVTVWIVSLTEPEDSILPDLPRIPREQLYHAQISNFHKKKEPCIS